MLPNHSTTKKDPADANNFHPPFFQSESGATESGSISSYANDSEIEIEIKQDPQTVTVPITVCICIMIG